MPLLRVLVHILFFVLALGLVASTCWLPAWRAALVSGLLFGLCHAFLATTVTQVGAPIVVFTVIEGVVAGLVYCRAGLLGASLAHGLAIFALAAGWV